MDKKINIIVNNARIQDSKVELLRWGTSLFFVLILLVAVTLDWIPYSMSHVAGFSIGFSLGYFVIKLSELRNLKKALRRIHND